jgi:hypothetical protein
MFFRIVLLKTCTPRTPYTTAVLQRFLLFAIVHVVQVLPGARRRPPARPTPLPRFDRSTPSPVLAPHFEVFQEAAASFRHPFTKSLPERWEQEDVADRPE